jgi:hypothetical protein
MTSSTRLPLTATSHRVVELASLAPSVHNTQPWRWRARHNVLELYADTSRQLRAADPQGRNMVISCGAALHQAVVAAEALCLRPEVLRLPEGEPPGPLARILLHPAEAMTVDEDALRQLRARRTDRRRFTNWPVPAERLVEIARAAQPYGVRGVVLDDVSDRFKVSLLVSRAASVQSRDAAIRREQESWLNRADEGIPTDVLPPISSAGDLVTRFPDGFLEDGERDLGGTDTLMVLTTAQDGAGAWLAAGEGMTAVWLAAMSAGLSVVPLSQPLEVEETRRSLQHDVLGSLAVPQVLLRVGWQPISRSELPRTPRRPVDDVLAD